MGVIRNKMAADDIQKHIREYGWHCLHVFDPEGEKQDFSYSIGFEATYDHPEVIVFGLGRETAHEILSDIASDLKNGIKYKTNTRLKNIISGNFEVMFKEVKGDAFHTYLGTAADFYGKPFRAYVLFWPDKGNRLPMDAGCEVTVQDEALEIV